MRRAARRPRVRDQHKRAGTRRAARQPARFCGGRATQTGTRAPRTGLLRSTSPSHPSPIAVPAAMPPKRPVPVASSSRLPAGSAAPKRARAASESSGDESSFHSGSQAASGSEASDDYSSEEEGSQGSLVAGIESDSASEAEERGARSERLSEKEKLRRWRRVGAEEREAVCSEGGAVWACAR